MRRPMNIDIPNFEWYSSKSKSMNLSPRCPIASAETCPRYYSSIFLLGNNGISTKILDVDKIRLDKKWAPFKPTIVEEEALISFVGDKFVGISRFCPEVSYNIFNYFASMLHKYADEIDTETAYEFLNKNGVDPSDPRWQWAFFTPTHYTECREYSLFCELTSGKTKKTIRIRKEFTQKLRWQILARDSFTCQYCGRRPPEVSLEVDHKISVVEGGSNVTENLITACTECNKGKGSGSIRD